MYAKIVVDIATSNVDELYTYKVPKELEECIYLGSRVYVEFGFQKVLGFVLELVDENDYVGNLKDIIEVVDFENGLNVEQIELAKKLATDLMTPLTNTLNMMYPSFMKSKIKKTLNVINYEKIDAEVALLLDNKKNVLITNKILEKYNKIIKEIDKGNIELSSNVYTYGKTKLLKFYHLENNSYPPATEKRQAVVKYLEDVEEATIDEIKENVNVSDYVVGKLVESGHLGFVERLPKQNNLKKKISYESKKTVDLDMAKSKFNRVTGKPYLLHTNDSLFRDDFLLEISKDIISSGKVVLIITPTIMENTRLSNFFENSLDKRILSFSSKLSNSEYYYNYNELLAGVVDLVVSTKSGVFLPVKNLGLVVVVDSEDNYYLNEQNPKYNTIEVAKMRAEYNNSKIIYTSSAPSIEDYYQYYTNKYTIISNINPGNNKDVILVNMKEEYLNNLISNRLSEEIRNNLDKKKISVLILNSLAYNQTVLCGECMKLVTCPHCKVGLSYHKNKNHYQCNSCNYQTTRPVCSHCGSSKVKHFGYGLELLKEVLEKEYKNARILQVDSETLASESDYQEFFLALEEKSIDIIIGTLPLASLYHPDINLVGLINIDSLLNKNDYRSSEEVYALVSKLVGARKAKVVIQGYNLEHYSILDAVNYKYDDFFEKELEIRKAYNYPPFNEISRLLVIGEYKDIYYFANYFKKVFARMSKTNILGPVYISRLKGIQLIIKYNEFEKLSKLIEEVKNKFSDKKLFVNFERYPISFN